MDWDTIELLNDKNAEIEGLKEHNTRLQAQLDREIKINRKMKRALKQIASENDCYLNSRQSFKRNRK